MTDTLVPLPPNSNLPASLMGSPPGLSEPHADGDFWMSQASGTMSRRVLFWERSAIYRAGPAKTPGAGFGTN
jgi:hypothetical protein